MLDSCDKRQGPYFKEKQFGNKKRVPKNAQRLWSLLRNGLQEAIEKVKQEDLQAQVLHHGLHLLLHIPFTNSIKYVAYIPTLHLFVSIDSVGHIQQHDRGGQVGRCVHFMWPLCGILYAWQVQQYVAWSHKELLVLDQSLAMVSRCPVKQGVSCSAYDSGRNHVLSGGCGGVTVWRFSHSTRNLTCHQFLNQGMTEQDRVTVIALDTASALPHTCFAVCRTSVWEYDLNSGNLLRIRRDLHHRRITGLLYSEFLQLLISGSRDGSIKIWNGEAQLKAAYLGHSGPVTALSLDVSGMTVYSGSEDSTLRSWDLETHEQVGEQQLTGMVLKLEMFDEDETFVVSQMSCVLDVWQVHKLYQLHAPVGVMLTDITTSQGQLPSRALCVCADNTVRLIAAGTGDLISTLLLDPGTRTVGAEYCGHTECVHVLLEEGDLVTANALLNPMSIVNRVKLGSPGILPICLTVYSLILDETNVITEWREVVENKGVKIIRLENQELDLLKKNR
ncbi:WD repeat-containing 97 isoform X1 [Pelobates cultripes]|uniref:WD repeat-containing 97 isoform X1 n=1 Tax=Pelobates cultripes TaxID=61616 RepID=A0AAD1W7F6_PELCU|nr:WD repeat-containing 97 isoform X1 [Pelobates cultripes]